jgi:hypothetical protein
VAWNPDLPVVHAEASIHDWLAETALALAREPKGGSLPPAATRVGATQRPSSLFDAELLARILATPNVDAIAVDRGRLAQHAESALADIAASFARGESVVVRRAERHDAMLGAMASACATALGGHAHVQLFATPPGARSFGWHYDDEDVLILQTGGTKDYWFRENTLPPRSARAADAFSRITHERSATYATTLAAGDALYLPRGTWHVATARTMSWSISIGLAY